MAIAADKLEKPNWFATTFQLQGSVVLMVLPRIFAFCGFAGSIALINALEYPIYLEKLGGLTTNVIFNLVLGLLIVFRTNTSYDRFWEGRKAWGALVINIRNLARELQIGVDAEPAEKRDAIRLLSAFAIATKLHLRGEAPSDELTALITPAQAEQLKTSKHCPLDIAFWIRSYLQQQLEAGQVTDTLVANANAMLNSLIEGVSSCERIITTPIPIAYRVFLKRLILIYCMGLPFRTVPELTWWSIPIMAIVSFLLLGVEEVGRELENPFGCNANDLPLDDICTTIINNVEGILALGSNTDQPIVEPNLQSAS
ncbi:MAG: bestrophin family ion channel [Cyanobacteria bacterium P01_A01_bin.17]